MGHKDHAYIVSTKFVLSLSESQFRIHAFLHKQNFFSTQPQCCLTFSGAQPQMLLRCCLLHMTTILRHILYLVYLCSCFDLVLIMSYLRELFFIFTLIFIIKSHENRHICFLNIF